MRHPWVIAALVASCLASSQAFADEPFTLPMPSLKDKEADECKRYSAAEFEKLLAQLKSERAALRAEWNAVGKRTLPPMPSPDLDRELKAQLKEVLDRLQRAQAEETEAPPPPKQLELETKKIEAVPPAEKKAEQLPVPKKTDTAVAEQGPAPIDPLAQGNALFRSQRYEEALTSFRLVDLKGRKAEARAPIQYLMALCLVHTGKTPDAVSLLREVANSRGDEKLAAYAQWELDMLRWQREIAERLEAQRQRRLAVEKKL